MSRNGGATGLAFQVTRATSNFTACTAFSRGCTAVATPKSAKAPLSALRIGGSYVIGGFIPLLPYVLLPSTQLGLIWSAVVTFIALVVFGAVKGRFTGISIWRSAVQTSLIGAVAAAVAFFLARLVNGATSA